MKYDKLKIIGREEWCTFSDLEIPAILARIDSGAKTSSIQATEIELVETNGEKWVKFVVHPIQKNIDIRVHCKAKLIDTRSIKGSFGISEDRFIIKTAITIGEETFEIEFSLANRNTMEFRMLLGREAIKGRYLINPAERYVQKRYTKKQILKLYQV